VKDRTQFWLQLVISVIVPFLIGSGGVTLLVIFREQLPEWLYTTFIFVIYLVFIVILIRLAFGDLIGRFRIWVREKLIYRERYRLVKNWHTKWVEMASLVNKVINSKKEPTAEQNKRYLMLRFWFIKNRTQLIPIWRQFQRVRTQQAYENDYGRYSAQEHVFSEHAYDPFSCFYESLSLGILRAWMIETKHWSAADIWLILTKLEELTYEFVQWTILS